jgi:hypothetical protein
MVNKLGLVIHLGKKHICTKFNVTIEVRCTAVLTDVKLPQQYMHLYFYISSLLDNKYVDEKIKRVCGLLFEH